MRKRREKLRALMAQRGIPAALITKPENMRYLTGYTGEGAVYLDQSQAAILTDFRYVEQAGRQAGDCPCLKTDAQRKLPQGVKELLGAQGGLAVETGHMTVKAYRELESALPGVELMEMQNLPEALRMVKEPFEQDKILRASEIACRAFDQLLGIIGPGMTELEVRRLLDDLMVQGGSEEAAFSTIACAGVNGSLPHAVASEHRLEKGELLTLDFGAQVEGYKTDMTRTVGHRPGKRGAGKDLRHSAGGSVAGAGGDRAGQGMPGYRPGSPPGNRPGISRRFWPWIGARGRFGDSRSAQLFFHLRYGAGGRPCDDGGAGGLHPGPGRLPHRGYGDPAPWRVRERDHRAQGAHHPVKPSIL